MTKIVLLVLALCSSVSFVLGAFPPRDSHERRLHGRAHKHASGNAAGSAEALLSKRFSDSRWTYYTTGLGACGEMNSDSDFIVALNAAQFGSREQCFKTISMTYGGKTTVAQIVDRCPACPNGGLDLSPSLFSFFDSLDKGVISGSWDFADGSTSPTSSSPLSVVVSVAQYTPSSSSSSTPASTPTPSPTLAPSSSTPYTTSNSSATTMGTTPTTTTSSSHSSSTPTAVPSAKTGDSLLDTINLAVMQMAELVAKGAQVPMKLTAN